MLTATLIILYFPAACILIAIGEELIDALARL